MPEPLDTLDQSPTPAYAVDADGGVVYANDALCGWACLAADAVVGRRVAYHSEPAGPASAGPLTGLCPPPDAFYKPTAAGTVSIMGQDGRLRHRRASFVSFDAQSESGARGVLGVLADRDLTPQELAAAINADPSADQLHRDVRRFRRDAGEPHAAALLLGESPAAQRLRAGYDLAVQSVAAVTVVSPTPEDALAIARATHAASGRPLAVLLPIDCRALDLPAAVGLIDAHAEQLRSEGALLLATPEALAADQQAQLAERLSAARPRRLLAAVSDPAAAAPELLAKTAALTIESPALDQRSGDLPAMAQYYVERANAASGARVGRLTDEALDQLCLYDWPGGAAQLGQAVAEAHAACLDADPNAVEITAGRLPAMLRHAALASGLASDAAVAVDLDALLRRMEREAVQRALTAANHNKAEAARLLGLTRQRFYRRLESLGLDSGDQPAGADHD